MLNSTASFVQGLVVGKFAPLHLGHEALIRFARARCRELVLVSYSVPELPGCDPARRLRWLRSRFPDCRSYVLDADSIALLAQQRGLPAHAPLDNDADDASHQAFFAWLACDLLGLQPDVLFGSEAWLASCADRLARHSGRPVAAQSFNPERSVFPVSARRIRGDLAAHWHWLAPEVRADFVRTVCLLGGESSGKTTLALALAERLGTVCVAEYGRELWETQHGAFEASDMLEIAQTQMARENAALRDARLFLVCDTSPLTTLFYAQAMFGCADPRLAQLATRPYSLTVLCSPDIPFDQDGTRRDAAFRLRQHHWYREQIAARGLRSIEVGGPVEQRIGQIEAALASEL